MSKKIKKHGDSTSHLQSQGQEESLSESSCPKQVASQNGKTSMRFALLCLLLACCFGWWQMQNQIAIEEAPPSSTHKQVTAETKDAPLEDVLTEREGAMTLSTPLPWICQIQNPDGSWGEQDKLRNGLTALALLSFLQHGETPQSKKNGETIMKAMKYLSYQKIKTPRDSLESISEALVLWALAEAYLNTANYELIETLEERCIALLDKQNEFGSFDFLHKPKSNRWDMRMSIPAFQAIKSCQKTGLKLGKYAHLDKNTQLIKKFLKQSAAKNFPMTRGSHTQSQGIQAAGAYLWLLYGLKHNDEALQKTFKDKLRASPKNYKKLTPAQLISHSYHHLAHFENSRRVTWDKLWQEELTSSQKPKGFWQVSNNHLAGEKFSDLDLKIFCTCLARLDSSIYYSYKLPTIPRRQESGKEKSDEDTAEELDLF